MKTTGKGEYATKSFRHYDVLTTLGLLERITCRPIGKWKLSTEIKIKNNFLGENTMILPVKKREKLSTSCK